MIGLVIVSIIVGPSRTIVLALSPCSRAVVVAIICLARGSARNDLFVVWFDTHSALSVGSLQAKLA